MNTATRDQHRAHNGGDARNQRPNTSAPNSARQTDAALTGTTLDKPAGPRKKATPGTRKYTVEDIALRAYFIAEKRHQLGVPGSPDADWMEAERQLVAEPPASSRKKKV